MQWSLLVDTQRFGTTTLFFKSGLPSYVRKLASESPGSLCIERSTQPIEVRRRYKIKGRVAGNEMQAWLCFKSSLIILMYPWIPLPAKNNFCKPLPSNLHNNLVRRYDSAYLQSRRPTYREEPRLSWCRIHLPMWELQFSFLLFWIHICSNVNLILTNIIPPNTLQAGVVLPPRLM